MKTETLNDAIIRQCDKTICLQENILRAALLDLESLPNPSVDETTLAQKIKKGLELIKS